MDQNLQVSKILGKNHWKENQPGSWIASTFTLRRNFARELFSDKQSALDAKRHCDLILSTIQKIPLFEGSLCIDFSTISLAEKEALFHHFLFEDDHTEEKPHQAVIINPSQTICLFINLKDHLILHGVDFTHEWYLFWNEMQKIDDALHAHLDLAYTPLFGFLTSEIKHCGTGLTAKTYLHLPLLREQKKREKSDDEESLLQMFSYKDPNSDSALISLSHLYSIGFSEEELLKVLHDQTQSLLHEENSLKLQVEGVEKNILKNEVGKSLGILQCGFLINSLEAQELLSKIKLGIDFEWIKGIDHKSVNYLFFHMKTPSSSSLDSQEDRERALFLQAAFKPVSLDLG